MYKFIWKSALHGEIPCNVQREEGDYLVIRMPDPHDEGEVETSVPANEVILAETLRARSGK